MMLGATNRELRQLTQSCARILLGQEICGSGYLVDTDVLATCHHVVATLAKGGLVECEFVDGRRERIPARIMDFDANEDVALLKLERSPPRHARPLPLGRPVLGREFDCYGFPSFARGNAVHFAGTIAMTNHPRPEPRRASSSARDPEAAGVTATVRSPSAASSTEPSQNHVPQETEVEISSPNLAGLQPSDEGIGGLSGSPVFAGGTVVAHLYRVLGMADTPKVPVFATVYAVPGDRILDLLCRGRSWGSRLRLRARAPLHRLRRQAWIALPMALLAVAIASGTRIAADRVMRRTVSSVVRKAFDIGDSPQPIPAEMKETIYRDVVALGQRYGRRAVAPILEQLRERSHDGATNTDAWASAEHALASIAETDTATCRDLFGLLNLEGSAPIYSFEAQVMLLEKEGDALRRCPGTSQRLCGYLGLLDAERLGWTALSTRQVCEAAKAVLARYGAGLPSCGGSQCRL